MDLYRELDCIDAELANIERDIQHFQRVDLREARRLEDIRNQLLRDRDSILRELDRNRDPYNRPVYGGVRPPMGMQNNMYNSAGWGRGNNPGIGSNSNAFINSSRNTSNYNQPVTVQSNNSFGRRYRTVNQNDNQVNQAPARSEVTDTKAEKTVTDALLSSLQLGQSKTLEIKFDVKEGCSTMEEIVSNNSKLESYLTSLVNFLVTNKLGITIEIDSLGTDKEDLVRYINNNTPNGEIFSNHVLSFISELYSDKLVTENINNSTLVLTEPAIILSKKDFDVIDEQLALTHTQVSNDNGRVASRKIYLGDYVPDIMKILDEQLRVSYSKRVVLTSDEALPRHLFLTKITSNNKFIITNK